MSNVSLKWITPNAEKEILYIARVSSPKQDSEQTGLIRYLIAHRHWSPFEMANMCLEIETSRAISAQILRHRSFSFQEFSQRYAEVTKFEGAEPRKQDTKNRQSSTDGLEHDDLIWWLTKESEVYTLINNTYQEALKRGIAKETARFILPMSSSTKLYMNGTIRSWIHYFTERISPEAQLEHRELAKAGQAIFRKELPIISEALGWTD
jgi:thymidylate synthase (FAD)